MLLCVVVSALRCPKGQALCQLTLGQGVNLHLQASACLLNNDGFLVPSVLFFI